MNNISSGYTVKSSKLTGLGSYSKINRNTTNLGLKKSKEFNVDVPSQIIIDDSSEEGMNESQLF